MSTKLPDWAFRPETSPEARSHIEEALNHELGVGDLLPEILERAAIKIIAEVHEEVCGRFSCTNLPTVLHSCPFKVEINDDPTTMCNCCTSCEQACRDDV